MWSYVSPEALVLGSVECARCAEGTRRRVPVRRTSGTPTVRVLGLRVGGRPVGGAARREPIADRPVATGDGYPAVVAVEGLLQLLREEIGRSQAAEARADRAERALAARRLERRRG